MLSDIQQLSRHHWGQRHSSVNQSTTNVVSLDAPHLFCNPPKLRLWLL